MIKENIQNIEKIMEQAIQKSAHKNQASLIAVSKTKPVSMIMEAYHYGIRDFGENKVQELIEKYEQLPNDIRWHMIGHLQRNKVKYIVDKVYLIHSVDSLKLAQEINREAAKKNVHVNILIEVNISGENSKFGISGQQETLELIREISKLPLVHIKGLMTVAPYTDNPQENRAYFSNLKQLAVDIMHENIDNISMDVLSMGMTGDYAVAIEEGATYIRIGSGIFGERDYGLVKGE